MCTSCFDEGLLGPAGGEERQGEVADRLGGQRVQLDRPPRTLEAGVAAAEDEAHPGVPVVCVGVAGLQADGVLELPHRRGAVLARDVQEREGAVRTGGRRGQLQRPAHRGLRPAEQFPAVAVAVLLHVDEGVGQADPGVGVLAVDLDRLLEQLDRAQETLFGLEVLLLASSGGEAVGLEIRGHGRTGRSGSVRCELSVQRLHDLGSELGLDVEETLGGQFAVVGLGPAVHVVDPVDDLDAQADAATGALDGPLDDGAGVELPGDLWDR